MEEVMNNDALLTEIFNQLPEEAKGRGLGVCPRWRHLFGEAVAPIRERRMRDDVRAEYKKNIDKERRLAKYLVSKMNDAESIADVIADEKRCSKIKDFRWTANRFMNMRNHCNPEYWTKELLSAHARPGVYWSPPS